jgi:hypothetical protein
MRYRSATRLPTKLLRVINGGADGVARSMSRDFLTSSVPLPPRDVRVETNKSLELELLAELRAALTEHDAASDVREEVGGLAVTTGTPGVPLWIFVSFGNRYFSWAEANHQHPVNDMAGAARRIAAHAQGLRAIGGES